MVTFGLWQEVFASAWHLHIWSIMHHFKLEIVCLLILTGKFPPDGHAWHNVQQSPNSNNFGLILNNKC